MTNSNDEDESHDQHGDQNDEEEEAVEAKNLRTKKRNTTRKNNTRRSKRKSTSSSFPVSRAGCTFSDRIQSSLVDVDSSYNIVNSTKNKTTTTTTKKKKAVLILKKKTKKKKQNDDDDDSIDFINTSGHCLANKLTDMIDIEEQLQSNRGKEKERNKLQASKNKLAGVDPRLFLSYYDNDDDEKDDDDDDELSMDDFNENSEGDDPWNGDCNIGSRTVVRGRRIREILRIMPLSAKGTPTNNNMDPKDDHVVNEQQRMVLADAQNEGVVHDVQQDIDTIHFASPSRVLELENGRAILLISVVADAISCHDTYGNNNNTMVSSNRNTKKKRTTTSTTTTTMKVAAVKSTSIPPEVFPVDEGKEETGVRIPLVSEKVSSGDIRNFELFHAECGGDTWRQRILQKLMTWSVDDVNALNLGTQIQASVSFLTCYESYLLGQFLEILDEIALPSLIPPTSSSTMEVSTRKRRNRRNKVIKLNKHELSYILRLVFKSRNVSRLITWKNIAGDSSSSCWDLCWHWSYQIRRSRWYDAFGQFPIIGRITRFPFTENFPGTAETRIRHLSQWGGLIVGFADILDTTNFTQNLTAEINGYEVANRNQFGTHVGRLKTNNFRIMNRLPVDESIVRSFATSPMPTMVNNGIVHVLRQLAKHWHNILLQPFGNFLHDKLEQIDPFETMRFHVPIVCVVLSSIRGRNIWDTCVMAPFLDKCQSLIPSFGVNVCLDLTKEMQLKIIPDLCAGVKSIEEPLTSWVEAIRKACKVVEKDAKEIYQKVTGVEIGLRLGYDLITQVSWKVPSDLELQKAILLQLDGKYPGELVCERRIRSALLSTTPRDKHTLIDLVVKGHKKSEPAQFLLGRVTALLKRDIRREYLNEAIQEFSLGEQICANELQTNDWYWIEDNEKKSVYIYTESRNSVFRFVHADSSSVRSVRFDDIEIIKIRRYIPVAESIVRAQRCYMNIEIDHGHKFKYSAFLEFTFLRTPLRRLAVISQIFCKELNMARLNILRECKFLNQKKIESNNLEPGKIYYIHDSVYDVYAPFVCQRKYTTSDAEWERLEKVDILKTTPQSMIIIGEGPTALMTAIHCTENVLLSGGNIKIYNSRDEFGMGGPQLEQGQIVRLDARTIAMLRYHLGTDFEDAFIPASGQIHAQLGNNFPSQGFVEITIKDLVSMLHTEVCKLWSKEFIEVFNDVDAQYDTLSNCLTKLGENLRMGDKILRRVDPNGNPSKAFHRWKITDILYTKALGIDDIRVGEEYGVYVKEENAVFPFTLESVNFQKRIYNFKSQKKKVSDISATALNLPSVYLKENKYYDDGVVVVITCGVKGETGSFHCEHFTMDDLRGKKVVLDIGYTHVVECIRQQKSTQHFQITTSEPYGMCCVSGLRVSLGMHNFGGKRIIGDCAKVISQPRIAEEMLSLIRTENWCFHFESLVEESHFCSLNDKEPVAPKLIEAMEWYAYHAGQFRRQNLHVGIFETCDNFNLGMELPREYEEWKNQTVGKLVSPLEQKRRIKEEEKKNIEQLREILRMNIDRLWFEACIEVILRFGDVYNHGSNRRVPRLNLINSYIEEDLKTLSMGDSFRITSKIKDRFEILVKTKSEIIVRDVEGFTSTFDPNTKVIRESNLARSLDGNIESSFSIVACPVAHYVNHRSICLNNESKGYVYTFFGEEQCTSHFMRNNDLTGGCINAAHFNDFIRSAINGVSFINRLRLYSQGTNWSNGEIVKRGTMTCFGEDGFLRPGFSYKHGLKFLQSKVIEWIETRQSLDNILSQDWKIKFAASMIPRGMELNSKFLKTLKEDVRSIIFYFFLVEVKNDEDISYEGIEHDILARREKMSKIRNKVNHVDYWNEYFVGLKPLFDETSQKRMQHFHCEIAKQMEEIVSQLIDFAKESYLYDQRFIQGLWSQPGPVDFIVDDFAVEAQSFANSLALSTVISSASVALIMYDGRQILITLARILATIFSILNIALSFVTMVNSKRYKIRNDEALAALFQERFLIMKKAIFSAMDKNNRDNVSEENNPFLEDLRTRKEQLVEEVKYFDLEDPDEFIYDFRKLIEQVDQPTAFTQFKKLLVTYYISDVYHVNSYVQERLVELYKVCSETQSLLTRDEVEGDREINKKTLNLFMRINEFGPRLEKSLRRGHGSSKQRINITWDVYPVFRYFWTFFCCSSSDKKKPMTSIENEAYGIIKELRIVSKSYKGDILRREQLDMKYLYLTMRESDVGSMVLVSSSLVFIASWTFTVSIMISFAGESSASAHVACWSQLATIIGALLASLHFVRKLFALLGLLITLIHKIRAGGSFSKCTYDALRQIRNITFIQVFIIMTRLCAVFASTIALSWSIGQNFVSNETLAGGTIPFWVGLGALFVGGSSIILRFLAEYFIHYKLSTKLGACVFEAFRSEIELMYKGLSISENQFYTKQFEQRVAWNYVAREFLHKYRFDAVFAADRFGSILQYLQCGLNKGGMLKD